MAVPQVVIVGRPNVGKSSLFNWLAGLRLAIVEDQPGVTRDRVEYLMSHEGRYFELVDTGGMGGEDEDNLTRHIDDQIQVALNGAAVILFVVDVRAGLMPLDEEVARRLRNLDVPVLCVANKADAESLETQAADFYRLGRGKVVPVSTTQNRNRTDLLDLILERLPRRDRRFRARGRAGDEGGDRRPPQHGQEHVRQHAGPGRADDRQRNPRHHARQRRRAVRARRQGLRRHRHAGHSPHEEPRVDRLLRRPPRQRSIRRADVVLLFFDATQRISKVDKQLCEYIARSTSPASSW